MRRAGAFVGRFAIIFSMAAVMFVALMVAARHAKPHDLGDGLKGWYEAQVVPGGPKAGQTCCNQADMVHADADRRGDQWWTRFCPKEEKLGCVDWQPVPDHLVIRKGRNIAPVVWYGIDWKDQSKGEKPDVYIRCFSPGMES